MAGAELNLASLTEEELFHVKQVLCRDKKLQANLASPTINNNTEFGGKQLLGANELVMSEIDRVYRTSKSFNSSVRDAPSSSDESADEGFFASFAGMISRSISAISINEKRESNLATQIRAATKINDKPKTPFCYNPRETIKKKPTLLELAASRRSSSPTTPTIYASAEGSGSSPHRRRRGNAMFSSLPATNTVPRSYKSGVTAMQLPVSARALPRSPSLPSKNTALKGSARFDTPGSPAIRSTGLTRAAAEDVSRSNGSTSQSSSAEERLATEKQSHEFKPFENSKYIFPFHCSTETDDSIPETVMKGFAKREPYTSQSNDSGIDSFKREFFVKNDGNGSSLDDDIEINYEPDTESSCDVDSKSFGDYADDVSLTSACSSFYGSPMKRIHSDFVQGSWDESDASSGGFVNPISVATKAARNGYLGRHASPTSRTPHWTELRQRKKKVNAGKSPNENASSHSSQSSPSLSSSNILRSGSSSPVARQDSTPSPISSPDTIGNLEISLVYYSTDCFNRKKRTRTEIPSYGTKSTTEKKCHVLSRREYVEVTNANLELSKATDSGAPECSDGELHVIISGAKFQDSNGKLKSSNTYVKCYLLPDKFHNSKMKSAVVKKSREPKWDHKFILAGFSQSELRERSLEIIVGSWHFKKQEFLGGATLSVGQGGHVHPWVNSTKDEAYVWKTALQISGNKVKTLLPLRARMKPTYV